MESITKQNHKTIWHSISHVTKCFYPKKCYNNGKVCCFKDEQQDKVGVVFLWLKFSWGVDLR